jgi:pyruvate carboxylase subunit B
MKVHVTDVTLRDAHQCLIATRLRTEDMLPVCAQLDKIGFWALEVWGGATFDACLRFLKESPWQRLEQLRKALPKTKLSMLLRGQNLLGYRHYGDDVVNDFVKASAEKGIDVFRLFDALNDLRNLECAISAVKDVNKHAQGAISYTTSPVHSIKAFVEMGKQLEAMGCDSVAIKDMAGLLTPNTTFELVSELMASLKVPVHLHSHSTSGLASICHYKAVEAGCMHIDTAISAFAEGASHPATESMVAAFQGTPYDTGLSLEKLQVIGDYFRVVRKKYAQFESEATKLDPRVQIFQVPGGMISNLYNQLKEQNALDKLDDVHHEIPKVRKDLGYPPLVTPTSQIVGTQAVLNVLTGERYKTITNEVKLYCQGKYGKAPDKVNKTLLKKAIGQTAVIEERPANLIPKELKQLKTDIGDLAKDKFDVLSYAMFPDVAKVFFEEREQGNLKPEPLLAVKDSEEGNPLNNFTVSLHGEKYEIEVSGEGESHDGTRKFFLTLDGVPEEVLLKAENQMQNKAVVSASGRPKVTSSSDIAVAMPSTVVGIKVAVGDKVQVDDVLIVVEAMKMETELKATKDGEVTAIFCQKGDLVNPEECLIEVK